MKKFTVMAIAIFAFSISSCKKDLTCECTQTHTSTSGVTTTDPLYNTTYRDIKKSDAKSLCQKETYVSVDEDGRTTTDVYDCKLK